MKTRFLQFVLAVWATVISEQSVWSQSTPYYDRLTFRLAAQEVPGNQQNINFLFLPPSTQGPVVTISDLTFTGRYLSRYQINSGVALFNFDSGFPLSIQFANGARAFGADFSSQYQGVASFTATLSLDNGETFHFTAPTDPNSTFFGFVSSTPIMNLTFSDGGLLPNTASGHEELIANVFVVTVPEPAGIVLAGFGAALLLGWRFPKHKS